MAHLIDMSNARANMAYVGETPWHGLGAELQQGATIDAWRDAAGLRYHVLRAAAEFERADGSRGIMDSRHVLYRDDTGAPLSVMSDGYQIVQPEECLEFFRSLCDAQGFRLETAGALKGGAVYWALARTGHELTINGRDRTAGFVLMSTSADGSSATTAGFTSIRVVCNNTLSVALGGAASDLIRVRHSSKFNADQTKRELGLTSKFDAEWKEFEARIHALSDTRVDQKIADEFFATILRPTAPRKQSAKAAAAAAINKAREIRGLADMRNSYLYAPGAVAGTAYGLVQAVTHYVDHVRGNDADKRLTSAWFGQGDDLKQRAMNAASALAGIAA